MRRSTTSLPEPVRRGEQGLELRAPAHEFTAQCVSGVPGRRRRRAPGPPYGAAATLQLVRAAVLDVEGAADQPDRFRADEDLVGARQSL